jgi:hypothetical protein
MDRNHYLFSLHKKNINPIINPINNRETYSKQIIVQNGKDGKDGENGQNGQDGPSGKDGDRFCTKTISKTYINPNQYDFIVINVEPGLAYISGNSVIVAESPNSIDSDLTTFEGTIQYYNKDSGQIIIKDITNIRGEFSEKECYYHLNLDGVDGEQGQPGPQGPSNISETSVSLILSDNTITIPEQINPITYYTINFKDGDELKNIQSNLKNNQIAVILVELVNTNNIVNPSATILPFYNNEININYNKNIILDQDAQFVMLKIYNMNNNIFVESVSYFKNKYITL